MPNSRRIESSPTPPRNCRAAIGNCWSSATASRRHGSTNAFAACPPGAVHLLGRLDADSITPLLRAADLFVWPAVGEAFGMAVLEAMGCGLPVLAGRSGGIADIVADGVTGRLVTEPSGENMAAAMEEMLAEPATLARMSAASVTEFNRHHRLQQAAEIIAKALADLHD